MSDLEKAEKAYQSALKAKGLDDTPENRYRFVSNVAKQQGLNRKTRRLAKLRPTRARRGW